MLWTVVKILVAPWTTHSRVSGMATGVHRAISTGSLRLHSGKYETKCPSTKITLSDAPEKDKQTNQFINKQQLTNNKKKQTNQ